MAPRLTPYPWGAVSRVTRAAAATLTTARRRVAASIAPGEIAAAASALLGAPVELHVKGVVLAPSPPSGAGGVGVVIAAGEGLALSVALETSLALRLAAAAVGRPLGFVTPDYRPSPALAGAAAAFVVLLARRCGGPWRLAPDAAPVGEVAVVSVVVLIGDDVFEATVVLSAVGPAPEAHFSAATLGEVPLTLPVVAALGELGAAELEALVPGAAWLPGAGWSLRPTARGWQGEALLVAPSAEVGFLAAVREGEGGASLVFAAGARACPWHGEGANAEDEPCYVLRAEVGVVTAPARVWAEVARGGSLPAPPSLGKVITLRAGGTAFARGHVAEIRGEAGVIVDERLAGAPRLPSR